MGSLSCTVNGYESYNAGWNNGGSFTTKQTYGIPGFGVNSSGYRAIVVKFTTPTFSSAYTNKTISISIPLWRTSSGTDTFRYRVVSTSPDFSSSANINLNSQTYITDNITQLTTTNSYGVQTLTTSAANFASNTTY